jgi:hypothetical protein
VWQIKRQVAVEIRVAIQSVGSKSLPRLRHGPGVRVNRRNILQGSGCPDGAFNYEWKQAHDVSPLMITDEYHSDKRFITFFLQPKCLLICVPSIFGGVICAGSQLRPMPPVPPSNENEISHGRGRWHSDWKFLERSGSHCLYERPRFGDFWSILIGLLP